MTRQVRRCDQGASFDVMDCESKLGVVLANSRDCQLASAMVNEGEQRGGGERQAHRKTKDIGRGQTQERAVLVAIMAG